MDTSSKSAKIVAHKINNPKSSYATIAKEVGCDVSLVYPALKKAGLTKSIKRKTLRERIRKEEQRTETPSVHALNVEIYTLRQQVSGLVAVVSYLENKLGIEHGVAV